MIATLKGTVEYLTDNGIVLEVGGIGFDVQTGAETMQILGARNREEEVRLYTFLSVDREGNPQLYGFLSKEELRLFRLLITVSGIGPKGALSLLSAMSADDLTFAILSGDARAISRAPGIGKKTAERLVVDLRDRLSGLSPQDSVSADGSAVAAASGSPGGDGDTGRAGGTPGHSAADEAASDAVQALTALGYVRPDAIRAVRQARAALGQEEEGGDASDTEQLLKYALRYLA